MRLIWRSVGGLVVVLLIAWVAALNAPSEQSLGTGIRLVYIHVGLIWVGLLGITVAGLCGLVALAFASPWSERWLGPLAWVGLGMFIAGFLFSMPAASVNWGAIFGLNRGILRSHWRSVWDCSHRLLTDGSRGCVRRERYKRDMRCT